MGTDASFGRWLKQRRKVHGRSPSELAQQVGCATITLQKIEAGERRPSRQIVERIADALDIEMDQRDAFIEFARSEHESSATLRFRAPSNLPASVTPLIGRERDAEDARKRLMCEQTRMLSLVGPPGVGKTRLALHVAADVRDEFDDGVFMVPLATLRDADSVYATVANILNICADGNASWFDCVCSYLRVRQVLLVLDNFEHVLPAAPHLARLLTACPLLKVMVTSRAALRVRAERQFAVSPLAFPDLTDLPGIESLTDYSAIALFLDRARAVEPDFEITESNSADIAHICRRLDGLPLALELFSAQVKVRSPHALLAFLEGRLLLEFDSLRDGDYRHHTLNNAIAWSYNLLTPVEQRLFRRLGVFPAEWTLEAVEHICRDADCTCEEPDAAQDDMAHVSPEVLDTFTSLIHKHLVARHAHDGEWRFTMLETIREFALAQLESCGELRALRRRHAEWDFWH